MQSFVSGQQTPISILTALRRRQPVQELSDMGGVLSLTQSSPTPHSGQFRLFKNFERNAEAFSGGGCNMLCALYNLSDYDDARRCRFGRSV
jgi:hypothetical protein